MEDVIIIGAGVLGCFLAHDLSRYQLKVLVLEKGDDVASGATMANSAIIHSGYDPLPHSEKAKFNVLGNAMYDQICKDLDVPFQRIGSMTLAFGDKEDEELKKLALRAKENGVEARILKKEEVLALEPHVSCEVTSALLAPSAGIINPFVLAAHLMEHAIDYGTEIRFLEEVVNIHPIHGGYLVETNKGKYESKIVINAAGVHAYQVTSMLEEPQYKATPRKGEYFVLDHFSETFVKHVLFTLPSEKGKGVLVSPTTSYNYLVGPSSEPSEWEDTSTDGETLANVRAQAIRMVPDLPMYETIRVFAGVRPTIDLHEFYIHESEKHPGFIELAGIESPGLASAPAISAEVVKRLNHYLTLTEKEHYCAQIQPSVHWKELNDEDKKKLIQENPLYGKVVCRCEQISEQEIRDLFKRSLPPRNVKAVKKRIRAGFGKCQGGMCQPTIVRILSEELHLDPKQVRYDGEGTEILKFSSREDAENE